MEQMNSTPDDYQAIEEISTIDLEEMKQSALEELNNLEQLIFKINRILDDRR